jgi:hypothetical protein
MFPDAGSRAAVEREQQRVPPAYYEGSLAVPPRRPGAGLAFGDRYAAERSAAAQRGWPVRARCAALTFTSSLTPGQVADTLRALLSQIVPAAT